MGKSASQLWQELQGMIKREDSILTDLKWAYRDRRLQVEEFKRHDDQFNDSHQRHQAMVNELHQIQDDFQNGYLSAEDLIDIQERLPGINAAMAREAQIGAGFANQRDAADRKINSLTAKIESLEHQYDELQRKVNPVINAYNAAYITETKQRVKAELDSKFEAKLQGIFKGFKIDELMLLSDIICLKAPVSQVKAAFCALSASKTVYDWTKLFYTVCNDLNGKGIQVSTLTDASEKVVKEVIDRKLKKYPNIKISSDALYNHLKTIAQAMQAVTQHGYQTRKLQFVDDDFGDIADAEVRTSQASQLTPPLSGVVRTASAVVTKPFNWLAGSISSSWRSIQHGWQKRALEDQADAIARKIEANSGARVFYQATHTELHRRVAALSSDDSDFNSKAGEIAQEMSELAEQLPPAFLMTFNRQQTSIGTNVDSSFPLNATTTHVLATQSVPRLGK